MSEADVERARLHLVRTGFASLGKLVTLVECFVCRRLIAPNPDRCCYRCMLKLLRWDD